MSAFSHDFKSELRSRVFLVFWAVLSLFLVLTGPFGSYAAFDWVERLLLVAPLMCFVVLVGTAIRTAVHLWLKTWDFRIVALVTAGVAIAIMAPSVVFIVEVLDTSGRIAHPGLAEICVLVGSMSLGLSALRHSVDQTMAPLMETVEPEDPDAEALVPDARLMQRIEVPLRGELLAISVRDHYVDVATSAGQSSLLMRLGDAIAEADPVEGAQVHRSHWVSWAAVQSVERDGAKLYLQMKHGARVPVSKNHRDKLELRGLL